MKPNFFSLTIGLVLAIIVALLSQFLSHYLGVQVLQFEKSPISPIFLALIIGGLVANTTKLAVIGDFGISFCVKYLLKIGIIMMGIRLSFNEMMTFGFKGLLVVVPCIIFTLLIVDKSRKYFNLSSNLATLVAVGTSICGATAIVATAPAINAKKEEIAYAIANITIFGIFAMVFYPFFAHFFFSGESVFIGLFLGSSIHETAQVAGAGMIYADQYFTPEVLDISTVTKLVRNTAMIIVIPYISLKNTQLKANGVSTLRKIYNIFPFFILGFIFFGILRTVGDFGLDQNEKAFGFLHPESWDQIIAKVNASSKFLLIVAMSAVGVSIDLKKLRLIGIHVFYYGLSIALFVGVISLICISLIFG